MGLAESFRLILRRWWFVAGVSLAVAAGVFAWSQSRPEVFEAEAVLDVGGTQTDRDQVAFVTARLAALAGTTSILRSAIDESGVDISIDTARNRVSAAATEDLGFVTVRARGPSPASAEALATGVTDTLIADREPASGSEDGASSAGIEVVTPASAPSDPIEPRPWRDSVLALIAAFVASLVLAGLFGRFTGRLPAGRVRDEVARVTDAEVLAHIPRRGRTEVIEAFRELRAQVEFGRAHGSIRSVAVTGVDPGDGASFVARGLAQVTANLKGSVVLMDANLRRPSVAAELKLPPSPGLGDVLLGSPLEPGFLRQANPLQKRFRVLTAGLAVPDAPGLLGAGTLRKVLDQIDDVELIIIDAPAVTEAADALVIAAQVDTSILVVDARSTRKRALQDAVRRLTPHARLLGNVVNRDPERKHRRWRR